MTPRQADHAGQLIGQIIARVERGQSKSETLWQLHYLRRLVDPPCDARGNPDWQTAFSGLLKEEDWGGVA